jgi:glycosyltransferase involved in cell wall biosynthesis
MQRLAVIPAYQAERTVGDVVRGAREGFDEVWVIDDGSTDGTADVARSLGARVLTQSKNRGKSAALRLALRQAHREGIDAIVTLDADGQHPPEEAIRLDREVSKRDALVLGVRDLDAANAPHANRRGNSISNYWLTLLSGKHLRDTQCGLRRYPVRDTLALGVRGRRFAFESEVVLRAAMRGYPIVELPVRVDYPPTRTSHFHVWKDSTGIVFRVIATTLEERARAALSRAT